MTEFTPRQKEALDISHSVGVTASAGTGKTFLLLNRFIALLRNGAFPHEILCLTFTDKAAAEMRDKIEQALRKESEKEIAKRMAGGMTRVEAEENNITRRLGSIHQCTISTFHSFCSGLLHEFPLEADVPVSYAIMDSLAVHDLVNATITDTLHQPDDALRSQVTTLFRNCGREDDIVKAVKDFHENWEAYASWFAKVQRHPEELLAQWRAWKTKLIESAWSRVTNDAQLQAYNAIESKNKNAMLTADVYRHVCSASTIAEKQQSLVEFAAQTQSDLSAYPDLSKHYKSVRTDIGRFIASTELFADTDHDAQRMIAVMQAFGAVTTHVHDAIAMRKQESGYLDFDDLIALVKHLLDENSEIKKELCNRYRYILVDEVQDNDPVLTKLVKILAEDLRMKNKLFVVGDMKQAIYEFRGADSKGFQELLGGFAQKPVELDVNYRTVPYLIDTINTVFSGIYAPGNPDGITYPTIKADRKTDVGSFTILHNPKGNDAPPQESERLAAWIRDRIDRQDLAVCDTERDADGTVREITRTASYRDIAILIRSKSALKKLIPALKSYRIPFHVYKGNGFYNEPEIADLMNVIRASVFHGNEPSLYGALISPYFGISDEQLAVALTAMTEDKDGNPYDPQKMKYTDRLWTRLSLCKDVQIHQALEKLDEFRKASRRLPLSAFIRMIVQDTGILSVYGALEDGIDRIRNVRKFLDTAVSLEAGKGYGIMDFIQTVETCIAESINDELGAAEPDADTEDRVQIMTVHVSKGLEFKVVALYNSGKYNNNKKRTALFHQKYGCGFLPLKNLGDSSFGLFDFLNHLINEDLKPGETASERRVFYVGMTRPRDHLVMTYAGTPNESSFMSFYESASADIGVEPDETCEHYPPAAAEESEALQNARAELLRHLPVGLKITPTEEKTVMPELFRYGSCIHELFEGRESRETICRRYGYSTEEMERFASILENFRTSPLLSGIAREWHEFSFFNRNGETRRADLVVRYTDGTYRIFDFKTDDFSEIPDGRRQEYYEQLKEYSDCLTELFCTSQIPACFYATKEETFIELEDITTYRPAK